MCQKIPNKNTLAFYRRLIYSMMDAFKGDYVMFHRTRIEARKEILKSKDETDPIKIQNLIFKGEEIRDFLQKNLVQATLQDNGVYRMKARKEHSLGTIVKPYELGSEDIKK